MKFGMNLLLWTSTPGEEHAPILEKLKQMGYDGVELPIFELDPDKFARLGKRLDQAGLARTAVTVRSADTNPVSPDPAIRRAAVEAMKKTLDCCQAAGVTVLAGPYHSALGEFSGQGPTTDEFGRAVEVLREVSTYAEHVGVTLALEYLNRFECYFLNSAADTRKFIEAVNHPNCRLMYDTFHAHIEEKDPAAAIRTCIPYLAHVHISENDRSTPGAGQVDWSTTFRALREVKYDGWLMIEAFGLALPELAAATKIWRRMYESEDQLARDGLAFMRQGWAESASAT